MKTKSEWYDYSISSIPINIGIETINGVMTVMGSRMRYLPFRNTKNFTVNKDNDNNGILIKIYEGQRFYTKDNTLLAELELLFNNNNNNDIKRGIIQITNVAFPVMMVNANEVFGYFIV